MSGVVSARAIGINPFPGLRPFQEEEEHFFFGRESQIDSMVDKLAASRFLAVVGTSGSGKSSLVNCGLKPALGRGMMTSAGSDWRIAQFRPGGDPIKSLANALAEPGVLLDNPDFADVNLADMVEATLRMSRLGVLDMYEQSLGEGGGNLLIIVDQFEEIFRFQTSQPGDSTIAPSEDKNSLLVGLLLEAVQSRYPIYVVITMRSDFLGDCARFEGLPEAINRGEYLVPRLTREERRSAIVKPVLVGGGEISPVLVTRFLNDVGDNPDQLPILQHALNRTWSRWQHEGQGMGSISLEHYEAIGTMASALDRHAEKAFAELPDQRAQVICKKIFQALTDKGTDARGVRRPTRLRELCAITEASEDEVVAVLDVFRKPSRSFVMPPAGEKLTADSVIDISHESLMRVWNRLREWTEEEAEAAAKYIRLVENSELHARGASGLMTDPELSLMLEWERSWQPNAAWARRYHTGFEEATRFLQYSGLARDAIMLAEEHARKQELRRTRWAAGVLAALLLVAIGAGFYAYLWRSNAQAANEVAKEKAQSALQEQALRRQAEDARGEAEQRRQEAEVAKGQAEIAKKKAEEADARAERNAALFMSTVQAQAAAQRVYSVQLEKAANLQADTEAGKDKVILAADRREFDAAKAASQAAASDAAQKAAEAFAVIGAARNITTGQMSHGDLFDTDSGNEITGTSGAKNQADMFSGSHGSPAHATVFVDGKPVGYSHWIEWRTKAAFTVRSVAVYAAHDQLRYRRAFNDFKLFAKKGDQWVQVAEYTPALPYGGKCSQEPCLPPDLNYKAGTVLAVCVNIKTPLSAREYRAEFSQAVSALEGFSGPRILQLDGFGKADCSK